MEFEWDSDKAQANIAKHGLPFDYATRVQDDDVVLVDTTRAEDGEARTKAIGVIEGTIYTVVYTMRGDARRIISARRANKSEERAYGNSSI